MSGLNGGGRLESLLEEILENGCGRDIELVLSLALAQAGRGGIESLAEYLREHTPAAETLGEIILSRLAERKNPQRLTPLEAELACEAARKSPSRPRDELVELVAAAGHLRTAPVLYAAASAIQDRKPSKAIELLTEASRLPQGRAGLRKIPPVEIARLAADLAYDRFAAGEADCSAAIGAVENFLSAAGGGQGGGGETFLYAKLLADCGRRRQSDQLLEKIAASGDPPWRNKARLYLIAERAAGQAGGGAGTSDQLKDLIGDLRGPGQEQLLSQALRLYCRLLLERNDRSCANEVLAAVAETGDPQLLVLKAEALRQLQRHTEATECMLAAVEAGGCEHAGAAVQFLLRSVGEIERITLPRTEKNAAATDTLRKLAGLCGDCQQGEQGPAAAMLLAELTVLEGRPAPAEDLRRVERLLEAAGRQADPNSADLVRCRARLFAARGEFKRAALLWGRIAAGQKDQTAPAGRSWRWWRAKYYELYCWSNEPAVDIGAILHNIEVLENSFADVPPPWLEKLRSLAVECRDRQNAGLARRTAVE
jgi:hypothetical protein